MQDREMLSEPYIGLYSLPIVMIQAKENRDTAMVSCPGLQSWCFPVYIFLSPDAPTNLTVAHSSSLAGGASIPYKEIP